MRPIPQHLASDKPMGSEIELHPWNTFLRETLNRRLSKEVKARSISVSGIARVTSTCTGQQANDGEDIAIVADTSLVHVGTMQGWSTRFDSFVIANTSSSLSWPIHRALEERKTPSACGQDLPVGRPLQLLILDDFNPIVVGIKDKCHVLHPAVCQPLLPLHVLLIHEFARRV
jgi:hypothetical protein